jgi:hypothetical protein
MAGDEPKRRETKILNRLLDKTVSQTSYPDARTGSRVKPHTAVQANARDSKALAALILFQRVNVPLVTAPILEKRRKKRRGVSKNHPRRD